jgi:PAS domain S-box-containing protein
VADADAVAPETVGAPGPTPEISQRLRLTSDDFFSSVLDAAPDGLLLVDGNGLITVANRQAVELFGIPRDQLVGAPIEDLLPEDVRAAHRGHRERYRQDPEVRPMGVGLLLRARRGDGSEFPVEVSLSPLERPDGPLVVATIRDVTARIETEDRMRRILRALDAADEAVFILDGDTLRFTYANDGAARQVGYAVDELVGMSPMALDPRMSEDDWRTIVDPLLRGEESSVQVRGTHRRRDGTEVPVEVSFQLAPAAQGGQSSIIAMARDLTARVEADRERRRSEQEIHEARQATAIAEDRERIARDLHDTVIQRLFASGLALQALSGRLRGPEGERLEEVVADLDETIREIRTAIFSLEAAGMTTPTRRGSILEIVQQATPSLGFDARLEMDGPIETLDAAVADALLPTLREALSNVAHHAHAHTARVVVAVGRDIRLTVTDDGDGIPDAPRAGGNGLRNMQVRAERLGGSCTIERIAPHGTRVTWSVPSP